MLKEVVKLITTSAVINTLSSEGQDISGAQDNELAVAIKEAVEAVGRHDEQKRKTDEAICLLFAAYAGCRDEHTNFRDNLVNAAAKLLGFVTLNPVSVEAVEE